MGELIDFLLFAIFVIYIIRSIGRFFSGLLSPNVANKTGQNQQQNYTRNTSSSQPGKIKVDYVPNKTKKGSIPDSEGEFVDYEEVK